MNFKNLAPYMLGAGWNDVSALSAELATCQFQPCGSQDREMRGFIPVSEDGLFVKQVGDQLLMAVKIESRILPGKVVKDRVRDRCVAIEQQQGFAPGRTQKTEIKDNVIAELLPMTLTKTTIQYAWANPKAGLLCVESTTRNNAEKFTEVFLKAAENRTLLMVNTEQGPAAAMTAWVSNQAAVNNFTLDDFCELESSSEDARRITYRKVDLASPEIVTQIESGMDVVGLGLTYADRVSFVLNSAFMLKRCTPLDVLKDIHTGDEDVAKGEQSDADLAFYGGEYAMLLLALFEAFGGLVSPSQS